MIEQHLGTSIDIHGGGNDLKFPHHENELAQSRCVHDDAPLARYWVHNGFVELDSEKMSKSIGNVLLVRELLETFPGEAIRLALIRTKYREPLNWSEALVVQAKNQLDRIYGALERLSDVVLDAKDICVTPAFRAAMDDDLNTPLAISIMMELVSAANRATDAQERKQLKSALLGGGLELGIGQQEAALWFMRGRSAEIDTQAVAALVAQREQAREVRDWGAADQIRDRLAAMGIQIQDGPNGTEWRAE